MIVGEKKEEEGQGRARQREFRQRRPRQRGPREEDKREHTWLKCHGYMRTKSWGRESHGLEKMKIEGQDEKNCDEPEVVILRSPGGLGALWCANRLQRQPFVSSESNKEMAPLVEENMH